MSIRVASDRELYDLCVHTLVVHGNQVHDGITDEQIVGLFRAIRIAQHAAYAFSYDEEVSLPTMEFPASAPRHAELDPAARRELHNSLALLGYNTVDQHGHGWLPRDMARLLSELRTRTARF